MRGCTKGNGLVWYGKRKPSTTHRSLLWKCIELSRVIKHQRTAAMEESMPFIYLFQKNTFVEFITKVIEQRTTTNKIRTKIEVTGRMKQTG